MQCSYCLSELKEYKNYGVSQKQIAAKLDIPAWKVRYLHNWGRLKQCLREGVVKRKTNDCLYRQKYGHSIIEIAALIGRDIHVVSRLHHSGKLAELLVKKIP